MSWPKMPAKARFRYRRSSGRNPTIRCSQRRRRILTAPARNCSRHWSSARKPCFWSACSIVPMGSACACCSNRPTRPSPHEDRKMKRNNFHIALFSTSLLSLACAGHAAELAVPQNQTITADTTKSLDQAWRVAGDARVEIDNVRGSVAVTGWDQAQVKLTGSLGADSKLEISGDEHNLVLRVDGTRSGWFGGNGPNHDSDLVLNVPRGIALKLGVVSAD